MATAQHLKGGNFMWDNPALWRSVDLALFTGLAPGCLIPVRQGVISTHEAFWTGLTL